ncbi:MAG: hypothetical protein HRU70_14290 [Phycisphaeraceae bacterium]|nr:MAG: hypothetical protein HRU70_14290 [Phycisphaeraceae bacterium]
MRTACSALLVCCGLAAPAALANDLANITLFGQDYRVQRFNYSTVAWADPFAPGFDLNLIEVEGAHWLGNDRLLLSTDSGDNLLSVKNWVIEVELTRDGSGEITGLRYVRTVVANDPNDPAYGGFDLSPCGITVNTSNAGLAAGGDLIIGDSEANGVRGYALLDGADLGGFSGGAANPSFDDCEYVPANDLLYTINEDDFRLVSFTTSGDFVTSTPIPGLTALNPAARPGSPKGLVYLPDSPVVPASIRRAGGTLLVTIDNGNPGLQAFDLDGNVLATEPLTNEPINGGSSLLDQGAGCTRQLRLESAAFDPATGTLFLVNEGNLLTCSGFFVLTPLGDGCPADFNGDGFLDFFDLDAFVACFEGEGCPDGRDSDYNGDGFTDFFDLDAYIAEFEAGC